MSIFSATRSPVVRVIDGQTREFPRLTLDEIATFLKRWGEEDRQTLVQTLEQVNAPAELRVDKLTRHADMCRWEAYGRDCLIELPRQIEVIVHSMKKIDSGATAQSVEALGIPPDELYDLAREIWGLRPRGNGSDPTRASATGFSDSRSSGATTGETRPT